MKTYRMALYAGGLLAVAFAAYGVGRLQQPDDGTIQQAEVAEVPASAATPAVTGSASSSLGDSVPHVMPERYEQFRVGRSNVKAVLADDPIVWIGTSRGVIRYDTRSSEHTTFNNTNALLSNGVFHLSKVDGELWVGTYGGGLSVLNLQTGGWRNYNVPQGMGDAFVYDTLKTENGDVWIATWSGANRIRGGAMDDIANWDLYTVENTQGGLPNDWVYGLAEGKNGEVWLATEGGLARFVDGDWTNWGHADGLGADFEAVKAAIPFKNDPAKVSRHHATQKAEQGLGDVDIAYNPNYIVSMAVDPDGRVWAGTWGAGLSVFDGSQWQTFTSADGLPGNHVFMLKTDPAGGLWVGTNKGLAHYRDGTFTPYGRADGLYSDNVFSMARAENGDLWVGSFGGVTHFRGGISRPGESANN